MKRFGSHLAQDPALAALGAAVRTRRKSLAMTQDALASAIGVSRQTVIALEGGQGTNLLVFARAAQKLGLSLATPGQAEQESPRRPGIKELMARKRRQRAAPFASSLGLAGHPAARTDSQRGQAPALVPRPGIKDLMRNKRASASA